jgi:hypothetical protein
MAASRTIFCGRFVSSPDPGPTTALEIKEGAVLISYPAGTIEEVDWTVSSPEEARSRFGVGVDEGEVVNCAREGYFFPGFVGELFFALHGSWV